MTYLDYLKNSIFETVRDDICYTEICYVDDEPVFEIYVSSQHQHLLEIRFVDISLVEKYFDKIFPPNIHFSETFKVLYCEEDEDFEHTLYKFPKYVKHLIMQNIKIKNIENVFDCTLQCIDIIGKYNHEYDETLNFYSQIGGCEIKREWSFG